MIDLSQMIDLRRNAADLRAALAKFVQRYAEAQGRASKEFHPPIARIDLLYSTGDGTATPFVMLNIDTRPNSEPDGVHTHPLFDFLEFADWGAAIRYLTERETSRISIVQADGELIECSLGEFERHIGTMLVAVLKTARDQGLFAKLPKAPQCEMGVEDMGGGFGWPKYEERGSDNLA